MSQSFSKANRLLKAYEFEQTLNQGIKAVSSSFVVVGKKASSPASRLGLIVSKKVGNAVVRNRVKRLLRESFRKQKDEFIGLDIVIIARASSARSEYAIVKEDISKSLGKIGKKLRQEFKGAEGSELKKTVKV